MNSLRFLSSVIQKLKQEYGEPLSILVTNSETLDIESGALGTNVTEYKIKRAVEVPLDSGRKFAYDIAFLAANKNFTYGGNYDIYTKEILVDGKDLPNNYEPNLDNYIKYKNLKYKVISIYMLPLGQGWVFKVKAVENTQNES